MVRHHRWYWPGPNRDPVSTRLCKLPLRDFTSCALDLILWKQNRSLTIDSFELLKVIGKGSFGKVRLINSNARARHGDLGLRHASFAAATHQVLQVRKIDTSRIYALKTIRKAHIVDRNEITHTLAERFVLAQVNNPFIVPLKFSFQSEAKLYLVLACALFPFLVLELVLIAARSFVNGGELFSHLQREGRFKEERSRFYCAELLLALEHLHGFNVVYRYCCFLSYSHHLSSHLA